MANMSAPIPTASNPVATDLTGHVTHMWAFDIAYEMDGDPVRQLLGVPPSPLIVGFGSPRPDDVFSYSPQMFRLPDVQRVGPTGPITVSRSIKLFRVGAISITFEVPFVAAGIEDLSGYHDLRLDGRRLADEARDLASQVLEELRPHLLRPVEQVRDEEQYTVFCVHSPGDPDFEAAGWLNRNRREVAALLVRESDPTALSEQEVTDTVRNYLSYYRSDVAVMDWESAMLVDQPDDLDDTLYVMELANVQLAELKVYDSTLDAALQRSYLHVAHRPSWQATRILRRLREIRVDLARLSDELSNATKFFGDWHLARLYQRLSGLFHLDDWERGIENKLATLDNLYQVFKQEQLNRWMFVLELSIVLLFIIDLVVLIWLPGK